MATSKLPKPKVGTDLELPERHVNMSNALARSAHNLSLNEKRVIACGIASTNSMSGRDATLAVVHGGWSVRINALDFADFSGLDKSNAYKQLRQAALDLKGRTWSIQQGKKVTHFTWMGRVAYHDGEGWIELDFSQYTAPHLLALRKNFTSYKLSMGSALRSVYSWRLLECLMSWKSTGVWHVTLDDFQHAMNATASHKKDFGMLRRSVIDPAIKELAATENLIIQYKPIKAGRKVVSLLFEFAPHTQATLFNEGE
jgi:plasmid replication initiation protein